MSVIIEGFQLYCIILFSLQALVQIVMAIVRVITGKKRHYILVWGRDLIGWESNDDNKEAVTGKNKLWLIWISGTILFQLESFQWESLSKSLGSASISAILSATLLTLVVHLTRVFVKFRIYTEGRGIGVNVYWDGRRLIGVDWHRWLRAEENGKYLSKTQQYYINRPHLDIPPLKIRHWPWQKHVIPIDKDELQRFREIGKTRGEEKRQRKQIKIECKKLRQQMPIQSDIPSIDLSDELLWNE